MNLDHLARAINKVVKEELTHSSGTDPNVKQMEFYGIGMGNFASSTVTAFEVYGHAGRQRFIITVHEVLND